MNVLQHALIKSEWSLMGFSWTFQKAIREGRNTDVQYLIQEGLKQRATVLQHYDRGDIVGSPLHDAVCANQLETVQLLIDWGAKIDYIHPHTKGTPIHLAALYGYLEILKLIHAKGGSMLIRDATDYENTPIHLATICNREDILMWLVSIGVSVNEANKLGETPLSIAVRRNDNSTQFMKTLIDLGANVNCVDNKGMTPLHVAVRLGIFDTVKLLLENGATTSVYCLGYGYTPLHWAVRFGMSNILKSNWAEDSAFFL